MNLIYLELFSESFIENLPRLFWAILVFLLGLLVSKWIADWVIRFLNKTRLNQALKRLGWEESFTRMDIHFDGPQFFGKIARFFIILLFLMASAEIIGLPQFSQFLGGVLGYFPNIFIASLIFIVAIFLADFSQKIVVAILEEEKITYSRLLGRTIRWTIWSLATLAILYQLQIAPTLILAIFIGFVSMIVLAVGIAFGLGGKEIATKILKELEEKIR
jgi:small-conductance mechanosensitive channel